MNNIGVNSSGQDLSMKKGLMQNYPLYIDGILFAKTLGLRFTHNIMIDPEAKEKVINKLNSNGLELDTFLIEKILDELYILSKKNS
ncbi:hypothetical protein DRW41_05030 [Neobacillus piezotolerans]|uniref:Uncharacterized protein n=1 Tax=Neobacillus piezotolerans TaxID=2259171 RepID=A0A3D8GXJ1_9BACI|nr:hypothetical protein [Neobacillus piezotolerans]RDU38921.1 hypothetical protein DRW41_05030 [Neobacillus piezotolerans]